MSNDTGYIYTGNTIIDPPPNPWRRISEVAAKLGVGPVEQGQVAGTIIATGADGKSYDIWEVITTLIDRMDKAAAGEPK